MTKTLLSGVFLFASCALAADPAMLQLVPPDAQVVAGVDMDRAKDSPIGRRVLEQIGQNDEALDRLARLEAATGFDPRRDLREVLVAARDGQGRGSGLVIARGSFDQARIVGAAGVFGLVDETYRGVTLFHGRARRTDDGAAAFVNGLFVAGQSADVKAAIDAWQSGAQPTAPILTQAEQADADYDAWVVSNAPGELARRRQSAGDAGPQGPRMLEAVESVQAGARFGSVIELTGEAVTRTPEDASALADVLRLVGVFLGPNAADPAVAQLLQSLQVTTNGTSVSASLSVTEDQLEQLLNRGVARRAAR